MVEEKEVKKALGKIIDPELGEDIVSLGFVKEIKIKGEKVELKIKLTTPGCPLMGFFVSEIENEVGKIKGVKEVKVSLI